MLKKLGVATLVLALACTAQIWAGTMGNGSAQRNGHFAFCFAGNPNVVYITQVITLATGVSGPNLGVTYGDYVKKTYGLPTIDRQRCVAAATSADAANEKQKYLSLLSSEKVVEIQWTPPSTQ